jgi:hypothetical protein
MTAGMRWDEFARRHDMNARQQIAALGGLGDGVFAQIEQIDNGMLVHYYVAVRLRIPRIPMGFPGEPEGDTWKEGEGAHEVDSIERRTVYCKDLAEVNKAVGSAHSAYQEILKRGAGRGGCASLIGPGAG